MELENGIEMLEWWLIMGTEDKEEALTIARNMQQEINEGKWDERKRDGYTLHMYIAVYDNENDGEQVATIVFDRTLKYKTIVDDETEVDMETALRQSGCATTIDTWKLEGDLT